MIRTDGSDDLSPDLPAMKVRPGCRHLASSVTRKLSSPVRLTLPRERLKGLHRVAIYSSFCCHFCRFESCPASLSPTWRRKYTDRRKQGKGQKQDFLFFVFHPLFDRLATVENQGIVPPGEQALGILCVFLFTVSLPSRESIWPQV